MPTWLKDAIFYEIYPQSFYDSNGDGIGDIRGITQKLDYVQSLGCNALWLNPIYDSPFWDAGYDVRDHKKVAERYGSNEDLFDLFKQAHARNMRVILDLVPGHTAIDHPWFVEASSADENRFSGRYVFTKSAWDLHDGYKWVSGFTERDGNFMVNFFSTQPALNYGFHDISHPEWQNPPDHPDCIATLEALKDVMRYWLDNGADGFRVDMADSLVKNDHDKVATSKLWRSVREMLDKDYPDAAIVAEWSHPERAINMAGFHVDFYLDHWYNGYHALVRKREDGVNRCYVGKDAPGDITSFTDDFVPKYSSTIENGYISFITCNHDTPRLTRFLGENEIKLAYALIFTMPGIPFLYYGDEIGMRFIEGLKSKEAGYSRTGSRTPMQWSDGKNLGFSEADPEELYLPVDSSPDAPTVMAQEDDPDSIFSTVKELISLRRQFKDLNADGEFEVIHAKADDPLFVYRRGGLYLLANPSSTDIEFDLNNLRTDALDQPPLEIIFKIGGVKIENERIVVSAQSFGVIGY